MLTTLVPARVLAVEQLSPTFRRLHLTGPELAAYTDVARPAWGRARERGLDVDAPIVVDEVLAEQART